MTWAQGEHSTEVIPSAKMVPMGLNSILHFSGHLEPSGIDARARQSFSFSSQNWPHGSRAETRRENDAKSRCEIKTCEESEKFEMHSISLQVVMFAQCEIRTKTSKTSLTALISMLPESFSRSAHFQGCKSCFRPDFVCRPFSQSEQV